LKVVSMSSPTRAAGRAGRCGCDVTNTRRLSQGQRRQSRQVRLSSDVINTRQILGFCQSRRPRLRNVEKYK
jgi:hypothetical protein